MIAAVRENCFVRDAGFASCLKKSGAEAENAYT